MYNSTKIRLKEKVFSLNTALCVIIGFILLMWFSITNWLQYNNLIGHASFSEMCSDYVNEVITAHARSGFNLFAPIFAVLPCATVFCDDYNIGYILAIFPLSAKRKYLSECIICCSLSGGLAVLVPDLLCSFVFLVFAPPHIPDEYGATLALYSAFEYIWDGRLVILVFLLFSFLFGVVWANIGLCISAYTPNRYVALAAPFALYYSIHLILQRTKVFGILSPVNMIQPRKADFQSLLFPLIYQLILLIGAICLFYRRANRRLKNV